MKKKKFKAQATKVLNMGKFYLVTKHNIKLN